MTLVRGREAWLDALTLPSCFYRPLELLAAFLICISMASAVRQHQSATRSRQRGDAPCLKEGIIHSSSAGGVLGVIFVDPPTAVFPMSRSAFCTYELEGFAYSAVLLLSPTRVAAPLITVLLRCLFLLCTILISTPYVAASWTDSWHAWGSESS